MEGIEGNGFVPIIAQASWFFHLHDRMILCFLRQVNTGFIETPQISAVGIFMDLSGDSLCNTARRIE